MLFFFLFVLEVLSESVSCILRLWVRCIYVRDCQDFLEDRLFDSRMSLSVSDSFPCHEACSV